MIDLHKDMVSALNTILPAYYEMALTSTAKIPCISYMELNNYTVTDNQFNSVSVGYSRITYQIKVWADNIADIQKYSIAVDEALRSIGFKRISSGELYDNNSSRIQKILTYECLALEEYK